MTLILLTDLEACSRASKFSAIIHGKPRIVFFNPSTTYICAIADVDLYVSIPQQQSGVLSGNCDCPRSKLVETLSSCFSRS